MKILFAYSPHPPQSCENFIFKSCEHFQFFFIIADEWSIFFPFDEFTFIRANFVFFFFESVRSFKWLHAEMYGSFNQWWNEKIIDVNGENKDRDDEMLLLFRHQLLITKRFFRDDGGIPVMCFQVELEKRSGQKWLIS